MSARATTTSRRWTPEEDELLSELVRNHTETINWVAIAQHHEGRSNKDCRNRWMKIKCKWRRGAWMDEEDDRLTKAVATHGQSWTSVSKSVGTRSSDQCAKHWTNALDPAISHGGWTDQDDQCLMDAVCLHGRAWKQIAARYIPNRSTLEIANRYDFNVRKLEKSLQSDFDKLGAVTASSTLDEAGYVLLGTISQSNSVASIPGASHITAMEWNNSDLEYTIPFLASSMEDFDAWNGLFPLVNLGNTQFDVGRLNSLEPLDDVSFEAATAATTAVPTPSNTPVVSSTALTPVATTPGPEEHGLIRRTSLTMENLDSDTRNKILDILCRRRISTTIDVS